MLPEELFVDSRVVVESLNKAHGAQIHEIFVANLVFGVEAEMESLLGALVSELIAIMEIGFDSDDGLDPLFFHRSVKVNRPKHIAMVGHRDGTHTKLLDPFGKTLDLIGSI